MTTIRGYRIAMLDVATSIIFVIAIGLLFQPQGQIVSGLREWLSERSMRNRGIALWPDMVALSSRLSASSGPVQLVEIADYECPFCRKNHAAIDSAISAGVAITYLHFPLSVHPQAFGAAVAATCADRFGKFREMHAQLMTTEVWRKDSNWVREAEQAGISDLNEFKLCLESDGAREKVASQQALGRELGVTGTPTYLSSGAIHIGTATTLQLMEIGRNSK